MKSNLVAKVLTVGLLALAASRPALAQSGTWIANAAGNWSTTGSWTNTIPADGASNLADFSTIDITAARTVTLDTPRTLGSFQFADTNPNFDWTINASGGSILTLNNGASAPTINVVNRVATFLLEITGTGGLTKNGVGTLVLTTNTYTGATICNGGFLNLNSTLAGAATNEIINPNSPLTLNGTVLNLFCKVSTFHTQSLASITIGPGQSQWIANRLSNGRDFLQYGGASFGRTVGGTFDVPNNDTTRQQTWVTNAGFASGLVTANGVAYLTGSGFTDWYGKNAANPPALAAVTYTASTATTLAANANLTAATDTTLAADTSIACLRDGLAEVRILNLGGFTLTTGGILESAAVTAGNSLTITNGTLRGPAGQDLAILQNGPGALNLYATIADNTSATALTKSAGQTLTLLGNNTYSGATYINAGTLQVGNGGTTGDLGNTSAITNRGTLAFNRSDAVTVNGAIAGIGALTQQGTGTLTLAGDNTYSGATTISAGTLQLGNGGATGSLSNTPSIANNGTLLVSRTGTVRLPVVLTGTGALTKQGNGNLILTGVNTYAGATVISNGTLTLPTGASISNSPTITLGTGASLDVTGQATTFTLNGTGPINQILSGNGTIYGNLATVSGSRISPGFSVGKLTFANDLLLNGGTFPIEMTTATNDSLSVLGNLTLGSGTIQLTVSGTLTNGTYKLISYLGSLTGAAANMSVSGFSQPGQLAALDDTTPGQINLVVTGSVTHNLVWAGNGSDNNWDVNTTPNWLDGLAAANFLNGDNTTFNDTGSTTPGVNLVGNLAAVTVLVTNDVNNYTFTGSGKLTSGAKLIKRGAATLTVLTPNDNDGGALISGGTLEVGNGTTSGNLGSGTITNNAALTFNLPDTQTVPGNLIGTGTVTKDGAGTLLLVGTNTWSGLTTINAGTVQVGLGSSSGTFGSGNLVNNGTLAVNRAGILTNNGNVSGTGNLTNLGTGTLVLGGSNSYSGLTVLSAGTVRLASNYGLPTAFTIGAENTVVCGGGSLDLAGHATAINLFGGTSTAGTIHNSGAPANTTNTLTVGSDNANSTSYSTLADNTGSGGKLALYKSGTTLTDLRGASTFSGGTIVSNGTLGLHNSAAAGTGSITLSNGAIISLTAAGTSGDPSVFPGNDVITPTNVTATINSTQVANGVGMNFYGPANATNVFTGAISCSVGGVKQFQNFNGVVQVIGSIRFSSTSLTVNGGDNTTFELTGNINTRNGTATGAGIALGAVTGSGSINGAGNADGNTLYVIGAKGIDCTLDGAINGALGRDTSITKVGAATLTLNGALNTYASTLTLSNGTLVLGGAAAPASFTTINLRAGTTLDVSALTGGELLTGLNPYTGAPQTVNAASVTLRGSLHLGATTTLVITNGVTDTLNVTNNLVLDGETRLELNNSAVTNSDRFIVGGTSTINAGAVLTVVNTGPALAAGNSFKLFSSAVTGTFTTLNLPALANPLTWTNKLAVDGSLAIVGGVSTTPVTVSNVVNGSTLQLSWPLDHTGWRLEGQTNSLTVGISNNWVTIPGSALTNLVNLPYVTNNPTVFYRLVYP